mmetsp:Transcript_10746/g.16394  ORF Transcript_10746/g.16394 Transcript_10746/m.16394 type:complete len:157 (+) Transcript_10746:39-509(+)
MPRSSIVLLLSLLLVQSVTSFAPTTACNKRATKTTTTTTSLFASEDKKGGLFSGVSNFFEELDAFVDDATNRRLGNGAQYYGKRKSSFYGKDDASKKKNKAVPDPTEDYQGPLKAGYFKWMVNDDGEMKPVTRMKERNIERNPNFWDRAFGSEKDE